MNYKNGELDVRLIWSKDDYRPITDVIREYTDDNSVILLKGSRGMALENVLEAAKNKGEEK